MSQKAYERWVLNGGSDPEDGDGWQSLELWAINQWGYGMGNHFYFNIF